MARSDLAGFWWDDTPPPKPPKKEKPKSIPPERFWERQDYLPGLEEARAWVPDLYQDMELYQASVNKEKLLFDIEVYPNYCLFAFKGIDSKKVVYFELDAYGPMMDRFDYPKFAWILANFCIVNFNGKKYDFPVSSVAVAGFGSEQLWDATCMLIQYQLRSQDVYKKYKSKSLEVDQIDLIELTSLAPGLKKCAGRLHAPKLQDLPFKPGTVLTPDQIIILRRYCINDLDNTLILYESLLDQIHLREKMSVRYGIDLRSHSDAQMAESIISTEVKRIGNKKFLRKTVLEPGTWYKYSVPHFIKYTTPLMNHILDIVKAAKFEIGCDDGAVIMPPELATLIIDMNKSKYKLGIGGLHSREKNIAHVADENYFIADTDATSYYPRLILNAGITPENLGQAFLHVYDKVITERVSAKKAGDNVVAECLKIVGNGSFGKLGSQWSIMYAPNLMIQVTITGQLSILMLAERFELAGIEVISVNTDGIVVKCLRTMESQFHAIVTQWEKDTGFGTEETRYSAVYSRDINNYIAVYETPVKGKHFKTKGAYGPTSSKKNAITEICVDAVKAFMLNGTPLRDTIVKCRDITRFTSMRAVTGGAVMGDPVPSGAPIKSGVYLGKLIRWYYATGECKEIVYAKTGNRVALTEGGKPLMDLPASFPEDVNYDWYEAEAVKILTNIGYLKSDEIIEEIDEIEVD